MDILSGDADYSNTWSYSGDDTTRTIYTASQTCLVVISGQGQTSYIGTFTNHIGGGSSNYYPSYTASGGPISLITVIQAGGYLTVHRIVSGSIKVYYL